MAKARKRRASDGNAFGNVAESLERILGQVEAQFRTERESMVRRLLAVRDRANGLLEELGGREGSFSRVASKASKAVRDAVAKTKKVGRRTFTAAQRAETSRRMKAYWAARRREKAKA